MSILSVHIEDVTATSDIGADIPIGKLSGEESGTGYSTEDANGAVYRVSEPKAVALIFSSGKIVCTGSKSVRDAEAAMRKVFEKIRGVGVDVSDKTEIRIEKIIAAFTTKGAADLSKISSSLEGSEYDPVKFPGLIYRMEGTDAEFLITDRGRIICTGARSIKDIQSSFKRLKEKLEKAGFSVDLA